MSWRGIQQAGHDGGSHACLPGWCEPLGPTTLWFKGDFAPEERPAGQPTDVPEALSPETPLCCARCGHLITRERHRTTINGRHIHTRANPYGFVFHFGCFVEAEGCVMTGPPTSEDSWFAGYAWEYAHCAACHAHLGWAFLGDGSFFGLVLDRLAAPR